MATTLTGNVIGKVVVLYGTVKAITPDGTVRILEPNSIIYADERIVTDSDGSVSIMLDGPPPAQIDLGRMSDVLLSEDVYAGATPEVMTDAATEAEKIQEALEKEGQIELEATAAGAGGAGGSNTIAQFALDGAEGAVTSGAETTSVSFGTVTTIEGAVDANSPPEIIVDPSPENPEAVGANDIVYEAGLPLGTKVGPTNTMADGIFTLSDPDGLGDIVSVTINGKTILIGDLGNNNIIDGTNGVLTITGYDAATGIATYTYQLNSPATDVEGEIETDVFTLTAYDGTATSAPAYITIEIADDMPIEKGWWPEIGIVEEEALPGGNQERWDIWPDTKIVAGSLSAQALIGADMPGTFSLSENTSDLPKMTSGGEEITYSVSGNILTATAGAAEGGEGGRVVFTLQLDENGDYVFTLVGPVDHSSAFLENWLTGGENLLVLDLSSAIIVTDADGDSITLDKDFYIKIVDDTPEAYKSINTAGYDVNEGAGEPITTAFDFDEGHTVTGHGNDNVVDAPPTKWGITSSAWITNVGDGMLQIVDPGAGEQKASGASTPVFEVADGSDLTISFKADLGQFTQQDGFQPGDDHAEYSDIFTWNLYKLSSSGWDLIYHEDYHADPTSTVEYTLEHADGGTYRLVFEANDVTGGNDKFTVQIEDITVEYTPPEITIKPVPAEGNLLTDSTPDGGFGADGGYVKSIAASGGTADNERTAEANDYDLKVTGKYGGTLWVNSDTGDYIYTPPENAPLKDVTEKFTFTLIDGDGDSTSSTLSILIDAPDDQQIC